MAACQGLGKHHRFDWINLPGVPAQGFVTFGTYPELIHWTSPKILNEKKHSSVCCRTNIQGHILAKSSNRPLIFHQFSSKPKVILWFYLHSQIGEYSSHHTHQTVQQTSQHYIQNTPMNTGNPFFQNSAFYYNLWRITFWNVQFARLLPFYYENLWLNKQIMILMLKLTIFLHGSGCY